MATQALEWDKTGEHFYESGVSKGVLYVLSNEGKYDNGVAWNGLTNVTETPSGAEENAIYADNIKYASLRSTEEIGGTIEAYTYPDEWNQCDGNGELVKGVHVAQQERKTFGLCYRTEIGNDTSTESDDGYKLHLVYGATASPSERSYDTQNDNPDAVQFSWEYTTNPVSVAGFKPTSLITIDSRTADKVKLTALETILYGSSTAAARLPLPDEVKTLMTSGG